MSYYAGYQWADMPYAETVHYRALCGFGDSAWGEPTPDTQPYIPGTPDVSGGGTTERVGTTTVTHPTPAQPTVSPAAPSDESGGYLPIGPPDYGGGGGGGGGYPSGDTGATQAGLGGGTLLLGVAVVAAIGYWIVSK